MSKTLRTAAFVIGAVALVASGVGAAAGAGLIGATAGAGAAAGATAGFLGVSAATLTAVGAIAGAASAVLSLAAGTPKGSIGGSATQFKIDKDAGLPVAIGRTYSGGNVVHRQYYGSKNSLESWVTVHSIGPVRSLGPLLINKVNVALNGTAISGAYAGYMWLDQQLGAVPEARALSGPQGNFPGWSAAHKLSGLAADLWTLKFDEKGKIYPNGVPQRGRIVEGVYVYDPRLDSSYPGGNGSCRLGDETTYIWSECPALHALTWAFGRIQNGVLIAGGGLKVGGIDMAPFVDWANVCDANGWKVGGIVYTTSDNSWDILKMIAQAGGGEVMPVGAQLSCTYSAPRVSIGTITSDDITGDIDAPGTASRRLRRNTVIARVRLETHGWEEVPLDAVAIPAYVTADGGSRPTELTFPLVQQIDQGVQLGLYTMWNGRELDGIVLPAKVYAIGYRPGDCLTVDIPEASLVARDVVVRNREIEGSTMGVTLTCRSETAAKHPFCLGKTGNAPPTPDLSVPPSYPLDPARASYTLRAQTVAYPVTSDDDSITIAAFQGTLDDGRIIAFPAATLEGLTPGMAYVVLYDLSDGTYLAVAEPATVEIASSAYVQIRFASTSEGGVYPSTPTAPGGDGGGGGGSGCVSDDSLVLLANADRTGPGEERMARDIVVGDWLWTQQEFSFEWGAYQVEAVEFPTCTIMTAEGYPDASADHPFCEERSWFLMETIGKPVRVGRVMRALIGKAHTYMARKPGGGWKLCHNKRQDAEAV